MSFAQDHNIAFIAIMSILIGSGAYIIAKYGPQPNKNYWLYRFVLKYPWAYILILFVIFYILSR